MANPPTLYKAKGGVSIAKFQLATIVACVMLIALTVIGINAAMNTWSHETGHIGPEFRQLTS